jgi:phosphate transport system substrate-binding protein
MTTWHKLLVAAVALTLGARAVQAQVKGQVKVDGSSTVYLITEAASVEFKKQNPGVEISVGISGTSGGFQKFIKGETDINDASRAIKDPEVKALKEKGIDYLELQVAWDGLAVVVHPENTWAKKMTVEQLRKIWHPDTAAKKWSDVDPSWPTEEIKLFGAGSKSGTFDYFTEAINGKERVCRPDYTGSEDDQVLVKGVAGDKYALGFFGLAYYEANKDKLARVAVYNDKSKAYVEPSLTTVLNRTYVPLSRPLFVYVRKDALKRPEVKEFMIFYLRRSDELARSAKYVPMRALERTRQQRKLDEALKEIGG